MRAEGLRPRAFFCSLVDDMYVMLVQFDPDSEEGIFFLLASLIVGRDMIRLLL